MDILEYKVKRTEKEDVRFISPDGQAYTVKEMLILSYLQIRTPAIVKFYGEESPLLHDMIHTMLKVVNDTGGDSKTYMDVCQILSADKKNKSAAQRELQNICKTLLE